MGDSMSINKLDLGNVLTIVVMVVLHFWEDLGMNGIDLSFLPLLFGAVALIGVIVSIFIKDKKIKTLECEKAESQSNATRLQEECDRSKEKQKHLRRLFYLFVRKFDLIYKSTRRSAPQGKIWLKTRQFGIHVFSQYP